MKKAILSLFFAYIFISVNFTIRDLDLWWHLCAGKQIVETKTIPRTDTFSYTLYGKQWIDFEWLSEAAAYKVQKAFGFNGLKILRSIIITLVFVVLYRLFRLYRIGFVPSLFSIFIILQFVIKRPSVRPELISLLFLAVFLYILERVRLKSDKFLIYLLPVIFLLWVNLHAGYVFGLILIMGYIIGNQFNSYFLEEPNLLKTYSAGLILCLFSGIINPYGTSVYSIPVYHLIDFSFTGQSPLIEEWQETSLDNNLLLTATFIFCGILMLYKYLRHRKVDAVHLIVYAVFSYLGFQYVRNIAVFGILVVPFVLKDVFKLVEPYSRTLNFLESKLIKIAGYSVITLLLVIFFSKRLYSVLHEKNVNWNIFPVQACNFIEQIPADARMYNSYNYGGYIDWRFNGKRKVFYDGRYIFYELLVEFDNAQKSGPKGFNNFMGKHKIDYTLLRYPEVSQKIGDINRSVLPFYFPKSRWALVYWDELLVVYVRRVPEFNSLIKKHEFKYFNPDDYIYLRRLIQQGRLKNEYVLSELDRYNYMYPDNMLVKYFLSYFHNIKQ